MISSLRRPWLLAVSLLLFPFSVIAAPEPPHVKADLLLEPTTIAPNAPFWVAVRLTMDGHWHTYWKNAGDSGASSKIEWTLPAGFKAGDIQWPYPERIELPPLVSFGYTKVVPLLVQITPPANLKAGASVTLAARVSWLECDEICIPGEAKVSATVKTGAQPVLDPTLSPYFSEARALLPLEETEWTFTASQGTGFLRLQATPPTWFKGEIRKASFFPNENNLYRYDATPWRKTDTGYEMDIARSDVSTETVTHMSGVLVSQDGWRGTGSEKSVRVRAKVDGTAGPAAPDSRGLFAALLFAFLGGLILNLMPCVLPVLSIKVLSLVGQTGAPAAQRYRNTGAYVAGVMIAFWALAGALIALRAGGEQLGWGFQLQSPPVVAALASLFFLITLNMFGVFEIGVSLTRYGGGGSSGPGASFSNGLLATIVATPCTGPFMGSALGFALTQPALVSLAIFTALGLGMASPFIVLAFAPGLLRFLPRPGAWMETMKQALGFLLAATVVWLIWVLGRQTGTEAIVLLLASLLLQSIGAWAYGKWALPTKTAGVRAAGIVVALLFVGGGVAAAVLLTKDAVPASANAKAAADANWEPYSEARVKELRASGKTVFIDFGAAWCLTCQVNERVALAAPAVMAKFQEKNIALMKADWTSRDPAITAALGNLGRSGVPTYVLYSADVSAPPRLLPEILTPKIVLAALDEVK